MAIEMVRKHVGLQIAWATIAAIALSSCAKTLEASKIEETIKADLNKQNGLSIKSITCPTDIKSESGKTFECIGELDPEGGFFVTVKQGAQGNVSWEVPSSWRLLNLVQLESEFKQKLTAKSQSDPKIDCGSDYRATKPGDSFECKLVRQIQTKPQQTNSQQIEPQPKSQPQKPPLQSGTIVVRVEPQGTVTWQEVQILAAQSATATASNKPSNLSAETQVDTSTPLSSEVGTRDESGWTQLND